MQKAKYLRKNVIDMVAITPRKANAQSLTCFITFLTTAFLSIVMMIVGCVLPAVATEITKVTCWISMGLEAGSLAFGIIAYWIKRNAL